jgi:hypothetical protein
MKYLQQCAAVNTTLGAMRLPPHNGGPNIWTAVYTIEDKERGREDGIAAGNRSRGSEKE